MSKTTASAKTIDATKTAQAARLAEEVHSSQETLWRSLGGNVYANYTPLKSFTMLVGRICLYSFGIVGAIYATGYLSSILMAFGIWTWLVMACEIIALCMGVVASWMLSDTVVNYIAAGNVTRDIKRVGSWMRGRADAGTTFVKQRMAVVRSA